MPWHHEQPRWRRLPEERPAQILEAALAVFGEKGLAGARLEDIAERAGISKGTIYLYFENKQELFSEVLRQWSREVLAQVHPVAAGIPPERAVTEFAARYWELLRSARFATIQRLVVSEIQSFPELAREYGVQVRQPLEDHVRALLEQGVGTGALLPGDNGVRARMLLALLLQHAAWCARREFHVGLARRTDDQVLRDVLDFFWGAVRVQPARSRG